MAENIAPIEMTEEGLRRGGGGVPIVTLSSLFTRTAVRIGLCRKQADASLLERSHCTGFFWRGGAAHETLYLITNWHNVTGWDPIQDRGLSEMAFTPDCVCFDVIAERAIGESIFERGSFRVTHDLYDASENPRWIEHPRGGREVDVVALNVGPVINPLIEKPHYRSFHLPPNECPSTDFSPQVGDDAFVIGFPERIDGGAGLPIFKRASIASEPDVDLDHQPKLLIDTATRHGMSGSPVIVAQQYPLAKVYRFLGIYGARIGDDTMGVQLGVVWKASVITDILCDGVPGRTPFDRGVGG